MPLNIKCNFCSFAELRSFPLVFPYGLVFLERLRLASMRLAKVSLFHRFSAILRPQEVCAFSFQLQPTVMGDCLWVTVPRICSAFAATSTFLLYFCFYFYLSALFLLLLLHFCHLEEYSAAKKINLLVNLN